MKYKLLRAQKEFLEVPHNHKLDVAVYQGGYGSGKTFSGSLLGILLALRYPEIRGLVGAQTFPLVRDTTLQSYFEHFDNFKFVEGKDYKYIKSEAKLMFKNGSEILFRYFENSSKLKSLNLGFAEIEEMSDVPFDTFKMLLGRLRQRAKPSWNNFKYRLFGHTNPEETKGWIYDTFIKSKRQNYRLIIAPTTENIYLPEGFAQELKNVYDPEYYRINVLGESGDYSKGLVVKDFRDDNIHQINYSADLPLYITCDFNVDPMAWILAHKTHDKVFFFDEIVMENTTTVRCVEEFYSRYPHHPGKIVINGDASGDNRSVNSEFTNYALMRNRLSALGYRDIEIKIRSFNPPIKNRVAAWNARIRNANGEPYIFIDPKCKRLIYNCFNLKYKEGSSQIDVPTTQQIKRSRELKFLSHPFDAASYLVEYYWPILLIS